MRQPRDSIVMLDLKVRIASYKPCAITVTYSFPVAGDVRFRNRTFLADVDDDVFRSQTVLRDQSESNISTALRTFNVPFRGCSPRPLNRPGGSARKLPAFSFRPSMVANRYGFSSSSLASFILYVSVVRILELQHSRLFLLFGHRLLLLPLRFEMFVHRLEIAFLQRSDLDFLLLVLSVLLAHL